MNRHFLCGVLIVVVSMTTTCQGERIVFLATPSTISLGVTPRLTVRCALEAGGNSQNTVNRINSIVIRRDEGSIKREVARIARGQAATGGSWAMGATVTGDLPDKVGYLQATWSSPGQSQAGKYNCEIVALKTDGTNIKFKSSIAVDSVDPSVDRLEASIEQLKQDIETLKKAAGNGQREVDDLKKTVNDLKTNINGLTVHNEEGIVMCMNYENPGGRLQEKVNEVIFKTPYTRNPQVVISPFYLRVDKVQAVIYNIWIQDLTPTGFKLVCKDWVGALPYSIMVRWTSTGS